MKIIFFILIIFSFLNSAESKKYCPKKVTTLFENSFEKFFEFKNRIYKIVKGDDRRDSVLMILDEKSKRYIVIENERDRNYEKDENALELMR